MTSSTVYYDMDLASKWMRARNWVGVAFDIEKMNFDRGIFGSNGRVRVFLVSEERLSKLVKPEELEAIRTEHGYYTQSGKSYVFHK